MTTTPPMSHNIEALLEQTKTLAKQRIAARASQDLYFLCREILGYREMQPHVHAEVCATTRPLLPIDVNDLSVDDDAHYTLYDTNEVRTQVDSPPHSTPNEPLATTSSYLKHPATAPTKISEPNILSSESLSQAISVENHGVIQEPLDNANPGGKIEATKAASQRAASIHEATDLMFRDDTGLHFTHNESKQPYDPDKKALHIEMPRGTFKSSVVTIGFALQSILRDPNWRVLIDSETYSKSKNFLSELKGHLEDNKKFRDVYFTIYGMYPDDNRKSTSVRWKDNEIDLSCRTKNTKEASFTVSGVDKSINGMHFDLIVGDDLHSETNVTNKEQIEKVKQHYKLLLSLLDPGRALIIIGTRWHYHDMYQYLLDNEKFRFNFYIRKAVNDDGSLLFPERLTKQFLADQRKSQGSYLFSCQYMNTPVDDEDATFKREYIKNQVWEQVEPIPINWYMSVDPSWEGKESDYAAICVAGFDAQSNLYVRHVTRRKMKYGELIDEIFVLYTKYRPKEIAIETIASANSISYMLSQEIKRRAFPLPINYITGRNTNKELRIEGLEPYYKYGRAIHIMECPNREDLEDELIAFPKGENDDMIDALATILEIAHAPRGERDPDERERRKAKIDKFTKPRSPLTRV